MNGLRIAFDSDIYVTGSNASLLWKDGHLLNWSIC
ncbi:hypothetical protein [Lactobacillus amylovorus]|nr:hypothetical protein [Lactobacillus amylovorus]MDB6243593.1 hypothetical protein [Lactobacillus amylovorus]MDB6252170.1 hypothetical protein [Lactobacillus amylovorus]MDB6270685.1 hypothetical protein [Lactobacillus amylovorus]